MALRLSGEAESAFWAGVRALISAGGWRQRLADALVDRLRPPTPKEDSDSAPVPQLALWVIDSDGLPPRPWRLYRDSVVHCAAYGCPVPAHICVVRQLASEVQRTHDTHRGQASDYPACNTARCAQGRGVRAALDPTDEVIWNGEGAGKRAGRSKRRKEKRKQEAARARLERVGLLDEVRTLDIHPDPVVEEEDGSEETR